MSGDTSGGHPDMDYKEHYRTFDGFIVATKIGVVFLVALLVAMAVFLV